MTSKRKPIRREVRYLYLALLKPGAVLDLAKIIGFYDEYNGLRDRVMNSQEAPAALKRDLVPLSMPKYLDWVREYLM